MQHLTKKPLNFLQKYLNILTIKSKMNEQSTTDTIWIWLCLILINFASCATLNRISKIEKRLESLETSQPVEKKNERHSPMPVL